MESSRRRLNWLFGQKVRRNLSGKTSINTIPHEQICQHNRKSSIRYSLPSWLMTPDPVLMKRHVHQNEYKLLVDGVELPEGNSVYS